MALMLTGIGVKRCHDGDGDDNANVRKNKKHKNRLNGQNNNSARASLFLVHFLPSLHEYDVKVPNFMFYGGREDTTTKFCFPF